MIIGVAVGSLVGLMLLCVGIGCACAYASRSKEKAALASQQQYYGAQNERVYEYYGYGATQQSPQPARRSPPGGSPPKPKTVRSGRRIANDGQAYSYGEFIDHFGTQSGEATWQQAKPA